MTTTAGPKWPPPAGRPRSRGSRRRRAKRQEARRPGSLCRAAMGGAATACWVRVASTSTSRSRGWAGRSRPCSGCGTSTGTRCSSSSARIRRRSLVESPPKKESDEMPEHRIGTQEEWQAARDELAKLEAEHAEQNNTIKEKRVPLPWGPAWKETEVATDSGTKTLAELFDGRSQLLAYNIMFGPDYTKGACPGCTSLGDGLDGSLVHLNHLDVTLLCFSRAPIARLTEYKERMGREVPYVSPYDSEFPFDFELALTEE